MSKKVGLLIIDPQNDFCDAYGSLSVPGANRDMYRLSLLMNLNSKRIDQIHTTMDSHKIFSIFHPLFWIDKEGNHPAPFTKILFRDGWTTTIPGYQSRADAYLRALEEKGKYNLIIWPEHCITGTWGQQFYLHISNSLENWEHVNIGKTVYKIIKGTSPWTEHYSAFRPEVVDWDDEGVHLNSMILAMDDVDEMLVSGEALSHCVASTVDDLMNNIFESQRKKLILLTDTTSPVTGYEKEGEEFIERTTKAGMRLSTTHEYKF
jgi:nicotinamidase/pyrazinamidase